MASEPNTEGVVVYTMDYCPYCERAKRLLGTRGVAFQEIHVEMDDDSTWERLFQKSGLRTMPQIYYKDRVVGGYTELADLDSKDQLQSLKG